MANYNTFVVMQTKGGKTVLVTSSARKAKQFLTTGVRIEVWCENQKNEVIYTKTKALLGKYLSAEKAYIREKQAKAEERNKLRRAKAVDNSKR